MKIEAPSNPNYAATVVRIKNLVPLENSDNLVGIPLFGLQAIVSKNHQVGELGIVFPTECQLSEQYCGFNNLFRHTERNQDQSVRGYMEDNRRVRAIRLRGNRSDALFMPISSLEWAVGSELDQLKEGDTFDKLGGYEICRKYVVTTRGIPHGQRMGKKKVDPRVDSRVFPEHFDSTHWQRVADMIPADARLVVTQKLHGTSIRVGNVPVRRKLSIRDRIAKKLGVRILEHEFDNVYGSRKVIKDANNSNQQHFYDTDLWTEEGKKLNGLLPKNFIVYGELVGWVDVNKPIQKNYTYNCPPGTRKLFVYRVSYVNQDGVIIDLGWESLRDFCTQLGLQYVPELWRGLKSELDVEIYLDTKFSDNYLTAIPLADESPCDEGVCIRIEGIIPQIYKAKSPIFLGHETAMMDQMVQDIEEAQVEGDG